MISDKRILTGQALNDAFNSQDWSSLYPKLQAYALFSLTNKYRVKSETGILGREAKDFVQEAIQSVWLEERKWNTEAYPSLYNLLTGVIDSKIDAFLKSRSVKRSSGTEIRPETSTDRNVHGVDSEIEARELLEEVKKEVKEDSEEALVFECMTEGLMKPNQIREELGLEESHLNNILKRLRRKLDKVQKKLWKS